MGFTLITRSTLHRYIMLDFTVGTMSDLIGFKECVTVSCCLSIWSVPCDTLGS